MKKQREKSSSSSSNSRSTKTGAGPESISFLPTSGRTSSPTQAKSKKRARRSPRVHRRNRRWGRRLGWRKYYDAIVRYLQNIGALPPFETPDEKRFYNAIKTFQMFAGLPADGILGSNTWRQIKLNLDLPKSEKKKKESNKSCGPFLTDYPVVNPLSDMSTFQSPGASGWRGAKKGKYRSNCQRNHSGWDIHAPVGTPTFAVFSGQLIVPKTGKDFGKFAILKSTVNPKRKFYYAHLSSIQPPGYYCAGEQIGKTGISGNANANRPHLHFEIRNGKRRLDPALFFNEPALVKEGIKSKVKPIDKTGKSPC